MIKTVVIGLWVCIIALGSLMLAIKMGSEPKPAAATEESSSSIDFDRTDVMSVPILADGKVDGYIIAQLVYTVDSNVKNKLHVPLGLIVNDAVFNAFYGSYSDTKRIEHVKFEDVKQKIIDGVNQRFPEPVVKDLMVEQFNFIPADQVRDMNKVK